MVRRAGPRVPRSSVVLASLLTASCAFDPAGIRGGDGGPTDGRTDDAGADGRIADAALAIDAAELDAAPCVGWLALNVDPCDPALPPPEALTLGPGNYVYDTDTGTVTGDVAFSPPSAVLPQTGGIDLRALNVSSLSIAGDLVVVGTRPLVMIVHGNGTIDGSVDLSARIAGATSTPGPGANDPGECSSGTGAPGSVAGNVNAGGGGGGGGGYGGDGDDGGDGEGAGGNHGNKGASNDAADIVPLRGGCAGGVGGDDAVVTGTGGRSGDGGGALEITALGTITVTGTIRASGSGGGGADVATRAGGGAAGSGGAILLDADIADVTATAALCANGGGGGEGGQVALTAETGENAHCSETTRANGGDAITDGGDGGDGGAAGPGANGTKGVNGSSGAGGGGGGGGVGRIRVRGRSSQTVDVAAVVSPSAAP